MLRKNWMIQQHIKVSRIPNGVVLCNVKKKLDDTAAHIGIPNPKSGGTMQC